MKSAEKDGFDELGGAERDGGRERDPSGVGVQPVGKRAAGRDEQRHLHPAAKAPRSLARLLRRDGAPGRLRKNAGGDPAGTEAAEGDMATATIA